MANSEIYEDFFDAKAIEAGKEELTLYELQKIVVELARKVAKLERHASFS